MAAFTMALLAQRPIVSSRTLQGVTFRLMTGGPESICDDSYFTVILCTPVTLRITLARGGTQPTAGQILSTIHQALKRAADSWEDIHSC